MCARLGREFGWLWSAYAVSTFGTQLVFGAFPLIAVRVLHASAFAVSALDAASLAVAVIVAVPLGPWVEHRNKRPVMVTTDVVRLVAMASVPAAYSLGLLSYDQLLAVSIISVTANIAFTAASGAYLKVLVSGDRLIAANARFEGTGWVAIATGPPLGGALIELFGPITTVVADAVSYLLSAVGVLRIRGRDTAAPRDGAARLRGRNLLDGWRFILQDRVLRRLFLNSIATGGLIMATSPLLAVLLLGRYHLPAWQYGLAFGIPCVGGFAGARISPRLVARFGRHRTMVATGVARACFPIGLAFTRPGVPGVVTVIVVEALLITCMGVFNPIYATERLLRTPVHQAARVLTAWTISGNATKAALTALWGAIATLTSTCRAPRATAGCATRSAGAAGVPATWEGLAALPPEAILAVPDTALTGGRPGTAYAPVVDGDLVTGPPWEALAGAAGPDSELVCGFTHEEYCGMPQTVPAGAGLGLVAGSFGLRAEAAGAYRAAFPDGDQALVALMSDALVRMPTTRVAEAHARAGGRTWPYDFAWRGPTAGAGHGVDVPFTFGNAGNRFAARFIGSPPPDGFAALSEHIRAAWTSFARTGDPGWPRFDLAHGHTRLWDAEPSDGAYPLPESRRIWDVYAVHRPT